jgi:hypothetical protein
MVRYAVIFSLILMAALSRLLPHPPNMVPITAMALFGGVYLERRLAFVLPIVALLISDYFIGFYHGMPWVYGAFAGAGLIGLWLRNHRGIGNTIGASLAGSTLFFIVSNFGVWASAQVSYPPTLAGLTACYVAAIPFFRNALLGDLLYVGVLFGLFELSVRFVPVLRSTQQVAGR